MSLAWTIGTTAVITWGVARGYNFIQGERICADLIDEFALYHRNILDLDRMWAENPARSRAIVSLTTIPSRICLISETLKSLMRQDLAPARIVLNLPRWSRRERCAYEVPQALAKLDAVEIFECDDWGPATKLIPTVLRSTPSQPIIVVDDDRIYPPGFIADLDNASRLHPGSALCFSGWQVPDDLTDRPTTLWSDLMMKPPVPIKATRVNDLREVDILQGLGGYYVRPEFFNAAELMDYSQAPEAAFFVDDVWISAHCRVRKFVIPAQRSGYPIKRHAAYYKSTSVALVNRGTGVPETRNNTILIRHMKDRWMCSTKGDR